MEIKGEEQIAAPRIIVWQVLNDVERLIHCIDGCEKLERVSDSRIDAVLKVNLGLIALRFHGSLLLSDMQPPKSYVIAGEGRGAISGLATGKTRVELEEITWSELSAEKRRAAERLQQEIVEKGMGAGAGNMRGEGSAVIAAGKRGEEEEGFGAAGAGTAETRKATRLTYHMFGTAEGKLAQLGSKFFSKLAHKVSNRFFTKLAAACEKAAADGENV